MSMDMTVLLPVVVMYKHNKHRCDSCNYCAFDELQPLSYLFGKVTAWLINNALLDVKWAYLLNDSAE